MNIEDAVKRSNFLLFDRDMCLNKQILCIRAAETFPYTQGNVYHINWVGSMRDMVTLTSDNAPMTWKTSTLMSGDLLPSQLKNKQNLFINAHRFTDEAIFMFKMSGDVNDLEAGLGDII